MFNTFLSVLTVMSSCEVGISYFISLVLLRQLVAHGCKKRKRREGRAEMCWGECSQGMKQKFVQTLTHTPTLLTLISESEDDKVGVELKSKPQRFSGSSESS